MLSHDRHPGQILANFHEFVEPVDKYHCALIENVAFCCRHAGNDAFMGTSQSRLAAMRLAQVS